MCDDSQEKRDGADVDVEGDSLTCAFCQQSFPSKTQLFRHLPTHGVETKFTKLSKVVLLVGWISKITYFEDVWVKEQSVAEDRIIDVTAQEVEEILIAAISRVGQSDKEKESNEEIERLKGYSRGGGYSQRTSLLYSGEPHEHSLSDTFACNVKPLRDDMTKDTWLQDLNARLPDYIRVHECYFLPAQAGRELHAETDCTQRRYECLLPLRTIMPEEYISLPDEPIVRSTRRHLVANIDSVNENGKMDLHFPAENEEGQKRVHFFRKIKAVFKAMAGRQRFHNFVTAGATPSEICTSRKLDRIYHKEIVQFGGEEWIVFSVSGDTLLRGQVRKLLGLALLLSLDLLPMEYLQASMDRLHVLDVPAIPGWCIYMAECRYANWEAKYPELRIDPRRLEPPAHNASLLEWNQRLHMHIMQLHVEKGSEWMRALIQSAPVLASRFRQLHAYWNREEEVLRQQYTEKFGSLDLEASSYEILQDAVNSSTTMQVEDVEVSVISTAAAAAMEESNFDHQSSVHSNKDAGVHEKKEKRKGGHQQHRNKHKVRKGEQRPLHDNDNDGEDHATESPKPTTSTVAFNGRSDVDAYRAKMAQLRFVRVPIEKDDVPSVYRLVLQLLRDADRSNLWPSSSTGRQMVIETETLVENGGRGGSFSVGALPRHMPSPRGNELFPELMRACFRLERALLPDRPPSATIAINRHAQFLPHRDTGAGAGQTKSLIVALGCFVGGEIVVDNHVHDIRYQPLEFDGWNSIHCTLPFVGERYSLVWFTPLGLTEEDMWWWRDMESPAAATATAAATLLATNK